LAWTRDRCIGHGSARVVCLLFPDALCAEGSNRLKRRAALVSLAFAYDLAAIGVPVAFIAKDQIRRALLKGEQTIFLVLFGATLSLLACFRDDPEGTPFGALPAFGPTILAVIVGITLRRVIALGRPGN
jgi:hypothetical protein